MQKIQNEFETVDWIVTGLALTLMLVFGVGVVAAYVVYLISRKVNHKGFVIGCYVTIGFLLLSALSWRFQMELFNWLSGPVDALLSLNDDYMRTHNLIYGALYTLPMIGYILLWVTYQGSNKKSSFVNGVFLFIAVTRSVMVIAYFVERILRNDSMMRFISYPVYTLTSFEPYLLGLVLALLYKEWFNSKPGILPEEEIYETYQETI